MNIYGSTKWIIASNVIPMEHLQALIMQEKPANVGRPLVDFTLQEIADIMSGDYSMILKILNLKPELLTVSDALKIGAYVQKEIEKIKTFYEKLDITDEKEKKIINSLESLEFIPAAAVRAVKYFNLKSMKDAQNTRLADVMLMDKAAAIECDYQKKLLKAK